MKPVSPFARAVWLVVLLGACGACVAAAPPTPPSAASATDPAPDATSFDLDADPDYGHYRQAVVTYLASRHSRADARVCVLGKRQVHESGTQRRTVLEKSRLASMLCGGCCLVPRRPCGADLRRAGRRGGLTEDLLPAMIRAPGRHALAIRNEAGKAFVPDLETRQSSQRTEARHGCDGASRRIRASSRSSS